MEYNKKIQNYVKRVIIYAQSKQWSNLSLVIK